MAYNDILDAEIESGAPLDNTTLKKIKDNFDFLKARSNGGGSLMWSTELLNSAIIDVENGFEVAMFSHGLQQKLKTMVKVPSSFNAGVQPKLKIGIFSDSNNNAETIRFNVKVILNKNNLSLTDETYVQTFNAIVNNSSLSKDIQQIEIPLSDLTGKVNSENIVADSYLQIELYRGSDSLQEDVKFLTNLTEIEF